MADEEKTETTETKTDVENFSDKMDEILKSPPAGDEIVSEETKVSEEETPVSEEAGEETPAAAGEELAAEDTETLKGIDPEVLECCRDYGWDDKKIAQVARLSPELFDDVRELLDEELEKETEEPPAREKIAETKKPEFEELKFNLDADVVGKDVKDAIDIMAGILNEQRKGLSEEKSKLQSERDTTFNNRIDACFDKHAKELMAEAKKAGEQLPVLDLGNSTAYAGKEWKQLTRQEKQQVAKRTELFALAKERARIRNISLEKAIAIEVNREKNQDGEKAAEQRLLNKMERQKKRFTNKPRTRKHSDLSTRKFATPEEEKEAVMAEAYKEAGIEE